MSLKNKYIRNGKLSESKFRQLLKCFALDIDAKTISALIGLNRNTVNRYIYLFRERIAEFCDQSSPFNGDNDINKFNFGKKLGKKHGLGDFKNTPVFGVLKREDKIYTEIVPDHARADLQAVIHGRLAPDSAIRSEGWWCRYNVLVDLGHKKHYRVNHHGSNYRKNRFNGINSFWAFSKVRLTKFNGISHSTFSLHLKECEFRYNYRNDDLYKMLLQMFREKPLI